MDHTKISSLLHFLVIFVLSMSPKTMGLFEEKCFFTKRYTVILANGFPPKSPSLLAHVFSGNDDMGYHRLYGNQNYTFSFCGGPRTAFFCHLWWGKKTAGFDLFKMEQGIFARCKDVCYWVARTDGIYYSASYPSHPPLKAYNWS